LETTMSDGDQTIAHLYPDGLPYGPPEYVEVEQTTRGPKWKIKALSPERFGEMYEGLKKECEAKGLKIGE